MELVGKVILEYSCKSVANSIIFGSWYGWVGILTIQLSNDLTHLTVKGISL